MALHVYLAFLLACFILIIVPGPVVTLVIASSLRHGTRAGLLNVAGSLAGLGVLVGVVAGGLTSLVAALGDWFEWVRLLGAAYLVWLGWKMLRAPGTTAATGSFPRARKGFFLQGFLVSVSNPKTLLFFGAFFPQFADPARPHLPQFLLMGGSFMAIAAVCDGAYAVLSGRAGAWLSQRRVRLVSRLGGACLIGGGAWLALSRR